MILNGRKDRESGTIAYRRLGIAFLADISGVAELKVVVLIIWDLLNSPCVDSTDKVSGAQLFELEADFRTVIQCEWSWRLIRWFSAEAVSR